MFYCVNKNIDCLSNLVYHAKVMKNMRNQINTWINGRNRVAFFAVSPNTYTSAEKADRLRCILTI